MVHIKREEKPIIGWMGRINNSSVGGSGAGGYSPPALGEGENMAQRITTYLDYTQESAAAYRKQGILLYRTKATKHGDFLDVEMYPILDMEKDTWAKRTRPSREAQKKLNIKNAQRKLTRLMNANFGAGDLLGHFTCAMGSTEDQAKKDARNFIKRLRTRASKRGADLKYIYVIEATGSGETIKYHIHMVINGGWISRDEMEKIWGKGLSRVDRCQKMRDGLAGFAHYITQRKSTQEKLLQRSWAASQNLIHPAALISDKKFSRRDAMRMAQDAGNGEFAKKYPGYSLLERPEIRYSDFLPGAYIFARLKIESA